jgi:CelD/BcsL family acetyltransferase involved in cellulose biosynthesis
VKLTVRQISHVQELEELVPAWDALWQRCPDATSFQRPAWLVPWCAHLLRGELCVLALQRGPRLIGLAPFFAWTDQSARVVSLLGGGVSDYLDVLCESDERTCLLQAIEHWLADRQDWQRCEWSELREGSLLWSVEASGARSQTEPQAVCPGLRLSGARSLADVVSAQRASKLQYLRRRGQREGGLRFEVVEESNFDRLFDRLEQLHAARWQGRGEGMLRDASTRAFHRAAARALLRQGDLLLSGLVLHDQLAAVLYGFHDRGATRCYLSGFDEQCEKLSPGTLMLAHALEGALARGVPMLDFLRGPEPYKYAWGATDVGWVSRRVVWAPSGNA